MISREKQKAIIEGLIFVSQQPVSLQQIQRKLRTVIRREAKDEGDQPCEAGVASIEHDAMISEQNTESHDTIEFPIESAENDDAQAMKQLMDKQKELDDDITREDVKTLLREIQEQLEAGDRGIELVSVAKGYQFRTKYEVSCYLKDEQPDAPTRLSPSSLETLAIIAYQQPVTKFRIEEVRGVDSGGVLKTLLEKEAIRIVGRSEEPGRPLMYGTSQKFLEIFGLNSLKDMPSLNDFKEMSLSAADNLRESAQQPLEGYVDRMLPDDAFDASIDSLETTDISEAEQSILDELDSSLQNLKDVEKKMKPTTPAPEPSAS